MGNKAGQAMTEYRLYFLDRNGKIASTIAFDALDDADAMISANILSGACADGHHGYELWCENRRVRTARGDGNPPTIPLRQLTQTRQRQILGLEETLQRSRLHIARSKRLLEATATLRQLVASR